MTRMNIIKSFLLGFSITLFLGLTGCSTPENKKQVYLRELFDAHTPYQQTFDASPKQTCEAARRALLSQGYQISTTEAEHISARKAFQPEYDSHVDIEFSVTCAQDISGTHAFANAVQIRYEMKKAASAASIGVSAIGSISLPVGNNNDSLVRAGSETITDTQFYDRFFSLLARYLSTVPVEPGQPPLPAPAQPSESSSSGLQNTSNAPPPEPSDTRGSTEPQ